MSAAGEMVRLPAHVVAGVDELVGAEERDSFVLRAVSRAVQSEQNRREIRRILQEEGPIWKEENHPELAGGIAEYVHNMRREEGLKRDQMIADAWNRDK